MTKRSFTPLHRCRVCRNDALIPVIALGGQYPSAMFPTDLGYRETLERLTVSRTWPLSRTSVFASHLPRSVEREVKDSIWVYHPLDAHLPPQLHCTQTQVTADDGKRWMVRCYVQNGNTGSVAFTGNMA